MGITRNKKEEEESRVTPKHGRAMTDIGNSRAGHLVRKVKRMINLALNKLSWKLIELGSNQGKVDRIIMMQKQ